MSRPSLSRPPPLTTLSWDTVDSSDVENEPPTAYNVRRHGPTNRKLFFTPTQKTLSSPSPTYLLTRDSITRRYYKQHENDKTPIKTPLPRRPSNAPSTARHPKITRLDATPSVNRTLHGSAPDRWRARQVADLTTWLNHELAAESDAATLPLHQVASSVVFLNQFAAMNAIFRSKNVHYVLARITNEICAGRLNVSKSIKLASFLKERDELISLLLLNYHPHWLLLGLSVVLGVNLATALDELVEKAGANGRSFNYEQVLMQALENAIHSEFLADAPSDTVASRERLSPAGQERDRYNALILRRALVVIYLLDVAKRQREPIIKPDPPLFRSTSEMMSSTDVLRELQKLLLHDHSDIVKFLGQRGYSVSYKSSIFESFGNLRVVNLAEDMRDGTRLCKLGSIMRRDHQILTQVIRSGPGHRPTMALAIKKQNITIALNSMKECLPQNVQGRFHWHATAHDIATGNIDKTVVVLWQIAALWMEYVVVNNQKLKEELDVVKNEFRMARRNPDSPSNNVQIDLNALADSPSKLQIIESCDTHSGDLLLMWCATLCGIYGVEIRDFTEDFRDGAVLCLILHHYCPELMRIDEIHRIPAGDHRGAFAAEAEHKQVQKNLDLFMNRCRLLGTIPEIFLSSEATLAPAFHDSLKQESVGRVMQLLASYLFRRMMMQKETSNARREVWDIMESNKGTPEMETVQDIDPVHESETFPIGGVTSDVAEHEGQHEQTERESLSDATQKHFPTVSNYDNLGQMTTARQADKSTMPERDIPDEGSGDLAHVYTRMRHVQSRRATRPRPSQLLKDREDAARIILAHYRGYKARKRYNLLRTGLVDVQSSIRGYSARREIDQLCRSRDEKAAETLANKETSENVSNPTEESPDPPLVVTEKPATIVNESTRSLPIRIGQQILELLPAFRRHMITIESYSKRMLTHERTQAEHQAATVIQRAARTHLAQGTRNHVETQRSETRRTWMSCAAEAAKTALRIAEEQRRELAKWHEQVLTSALQQAEGRYKSEMSRYETARQDAVLEGQRRSDMKTAQEASFTRELHRHQMAFEEEMTEMQRRIQGLEARTAARHEIPVSSVECRQEAKIYEDVLSSVHKSEAQEDAIQLILTDLDTERQKANHLESELKKLRNHEGETKETVLRLNSEWEEKLQSMETEMQNWHGTVLNGAVCLARAQYRFHMDELGAVRLNEDQERLAWEEQLQKGLELFDVEERKDRLLLGDVLTQLEADAKNSRNVVLAREEFLSQWNENELQSEQCQRAIEADLSLLSAKASDADISWMSGTEEFDVQAEDMLRRIADIEKIQLEDKCCIDSLDEEIENLIVVEQREETKRRIIDILESAAGKYYDKIYELAEENENILYCRQEISNQLQQEDQEAVADDEEFEKSMIEINCDVDRVKDGRAELDEHLALLDSYIVHLFSMSPSTMVSEDVPDILGEDMADGCDECSALYSQTCEVIERLYVDTSEADIESDRDQSVSEESDYQTSFEDGRDTRGNPLSAEEFKSPEHAVLGDESIDGSTSVDGNVSLTVGPGLYRRLVEQEFEYYNGKTTYDIGVQTGSGPNSLSSTPAQDTRAEEHSCQVSDRESQPCEEEQSSTGYSSEMSSGRKRSLSLAQSESTQNDSNVCEPLSARDMDGCQTSRHSLSCAAIDASKSPMSTPSAPQETLYDSIVGMDADNRHGSPGALDTLAQLALQDSSYRNTFESGNRVPTSESPSLPPSREQHTSASYREGKENAVDISGLSASKNSDLKIYGLRLDNPLRTWNSPVWTHGGDEHEMDGIENEQKTSDYEPIQSALEDATVTPHGDRHSEVREAENAFQSAKPDNLGNLSVELNAFNIQPHRQSVESVVEDPLSADKLESVMRRISIAASSPQVKWSPVDKVPEGEQGPHCDIVRTIFTLIRYCSRSHKQLKLRELGISIIRDFCVVHNRIADIMAVEECIDVLTTCIQYHRDQYSIFDPTIRILWEIALHPDGKQLIMDSKESVSMLQSVNEMLASQSAREQRNRDRIRQANMIVDIVRKRRAEGGSLQSMTEALRNAREQKLNSDVPVKDSHRLLGDLVDIVSSLV